MPVDLSYELAEIKVDTSALAEVEEDIDLTSTDEYEFHDGDESSPYIVFSSTR